MRALNILAVAAIAFSAATIQSYAQSSGQQGADSAQQGGSAGSTDGSGTGPHDTGSTGWTGGNRSTNPGPPGAPNGVTVSDSVDKQPPVATGQDLKGPPKAFPSNKAPE